MTTTPPLKKKKAKSKKAPKKKPATSPETPPLKKKKGADFGLNPNQSLFCEIYATTEEFFGNGTKAYMKAYNAKNYLAAMSSASDLLKLPKVCEYINYLLELGALNDEFVDKQLAFLITQHADPKVKVSAIKEYNALKQRVTKKLEVGMSPELKAFMETMNAALERDDV